MQKVSETLNRAADLIEERGWVRGAGWGLGGERDGGLCLEGGIIAALGLDAEDVFGRREAESAFRACESYQAVVAYLGLMQREGVGGVNTYAYDWNDNSDRTAAEVIEVLRATAVIEEARETEAAAVSV